MPSSSGQAVGSRSGIGVIAEGVVEPAIGQGRDVSDTRSVSRSAVRWCRRRRLGAHGLLGDGADEQLVPTLSGLEIKKRTESPALHGELVGQSGSRLSNLDHSWLGPSPMAAPPQAERPTMSAAASAARLWCVPDVPPSVHTSIGRRTRDSRGRGVPPSAEGTPWGSRWAPDRTELGVRLTRWTVRTSCPDGGSRPAGSTSPRAADHRFDAGHVVAFEQADAFLRPLMNEDIVRPRTSRAREATDPVPHPGAAFNRELAEWWSAPDWNVAARRVRSLSSSRATRRTTGRVVRIGLCEQAVLLSRRRNGCPIMASTEAVHA